MSAAPRVGATWQERFEQKKQRDALIDQLRALDKHRDTLRASIADAAFLCAEPPWGTLGTEKEALWVAQQQEKVDRRAARRAWEASWAGVVPPGEWDADIDKHFETQSITFDLGDGYMGQIRRNRDYGWNAYIVLPKGHALHGKSYEELGRFSYSAPIEDDRWMFGYCHDREGGDTVPKHHYRRYYADDGWNGDARNGRKISLATFQPIPFLTAEDVQAELVRVKKSLMPEAERTALEAQEAAAAAEAERKRRAEVDAMLADLDKKEKARKAAERKAAERKARSWASVVAAKA